MLIGASQRPLPRFLPRPTGRWRNACGTINHAGQPYSEQPFARRACTTEAHLTPISLEESHVLYEPGSSIKEVYFVTSGMVSIVAVMQTGAAIETGIIGS